MSRTVTVPALVGLCFALAACDKNPAGDLTGPEPPKASVSEAIGTAAALRYAVIHLTTQPGTAFGINRLGQVVGSYVAPGNNGNLQAFLWDNGAIRDLGALGGSFSQAFAINAAGQVVGEAELGDNLFNSHAFLWQNGVMRDLGALGVPPTGFTSLSSQATDINAQGQVVGWSYTSDLNRRAFIWENGQMRRLPELESLFSRAFGIDNNGRVVGDFGGSQTRRGFYWKNGTVQSIVPASGTAFPAEINDEGKVVGSISFPDGTSHAFLWRGGVTTDLGTLSGFASSSAQSINGAGTVVGWNQKAPGSASINAFVWQNGVMSDLGPGQAHGINRDGWVVGGGVDPAVSGTTQNIPTLWKPTNDPPPPPPPPGLVRVGSRFFASARNHSFNPAVDTVTAGTRVTWDWFGGNHTVQSLSSPGFTSSAVMGGADGLYQFTFNQRGTFLYNCAVHGNRMTGRIVVR
jgi:probable HAF family extracellular repeat protein